VLSFAYKQHVTQILVGESVRSRWQEILRSEPLAEEPTMALKDTMASIVEAEPGGQRKPFTR
jgi:K+-sensing histidine kinase KdpD